MSQKQDDDSMAALVDTLRQLTEEVHGLHRDLRQIQHMIRVSAALLTFALIVMTLVLLFR
jgi:hypothetical protein